jgi:hypothetical protein
MAGLNRRERDEIAAMERLFGAMGETYEEPARYVPLEEGGDDGEAERLAEMGPDVDAWSDAEWEAWDADFARQEAERNSYDLPF